MAMKWGWHIPYISIKYRSPISVRAAPFTGKEVIFCQRNCNDLSSVHTPTSCLTRIIKTNWKKNGLIIKCRGMADDNRGIENEGPSEKPGSGRTNLTKIFLELIKAISNQFQQLQKNFPVKIFSLLLGFYCATLIVTSVGQTGDWDILSAGLAVAMVEAIGALMYKAYPLMQKLHGFVTLVNFWKAGLSLGLFLDAFKYEMDEFGTFLDTVKPDIDPTFLSWW